MVVRRASSSSTSAATSRAGISRRTTRTSSWRGTQCATAFIQAFDLAHHGQWDEIEEIEPLTRGAALLTKVLWVYFPDDLLPITSSENLRHFLRVAGRDDVASDQSVRTIRLNRALLAELRSHSELAQASTKALERLLYMRFSPFRGPPREDRAGRGRTLLA